MNEDLPVDLAALHVVTTADHEISLPPPTHTAGLLFGRVVRPQISWNHSPPRSARLVAVDIDSVRALPGIVEVVVRGNFVGVVATSDQAAKYGASKLRVKWSLSEAGPRRGPARPATQDMLAEHGDAAAAMRNSCHTIEATYRWPLENSSLKTACTALADFGENGVTVWAATAASTALREEIAALLGLSASRVTLVSLPQGGEGEDGIRHAAADAALMAQAVGQPVQVQLTPEDMGISADDACVLASHLSSAVDSDGTISAYTVATSATPLATPPLALVLSGVQSPFTDMPSGTDPSAIPPYTFANLRVTVASAAGTAPVVDPFRAAKMAHIFAHESHLDEIATRTGTDPVALRLRHLDDPKGAALMRKVADQAEWDQSRTRMPTGAHGGPADSRLRRGRGFAYAHTIEADCGRETASWSAWVADVEVDTVSGDVRVTRVVVGHDQEPGAAEPPATQVSEDLVIETARRLVSSGPSFDTWDTAPTPQANLPATAMTGKPKATEVNIVAGSQAPTPLLQGSAAAMLPAAAAVANAIFDATGVRLREPPFTSERLRLGLGLENHNSPSVPGKRKRNLFLAALAATTGVIATLMPWRAPIAPVSPLDPGFYSAAAVERGRLVAAAGDCMVCHTAPGGIKNAGGLALDTPFGVIYSTNITPDVETGIGNWSYAAFERAMRHGIHRDGRRLYPAFPYTAFAKITDNDMHGLYAYLMSQQPIRSKAPETKLAFPFNMRPLMAGWNLLFHDATPFKPDSTRSAEWNRGAYLAEGLGHCSACHTERNRFGAESGGKAYLAGGMVEGWEAPPLTSLSHAPIPWTEEELFRYLRFGYSALHGPAAGPMAPVVQGLAELPESDVRAIAAYVASFNQNTVDADIAAMQAAPETQLQERSRAARVLLNGKGDRIFQGACAVCHQSEQGSPLFGEKPPLALNSNLHSTRPDNLIQVLLKGIPAPAAVDIGFMPGFADSLDDQQLTELTRYLRARFAPDKPEWKNLPETIARIRAEASGHQPVTKDKGMK